MSVYDSKEYARRYKARKDAQEYLPYDPLTLKRIMPTLEDFEIYSHQDFREKYFQSDFPLPSPAQDEWDTIIDERRQLVILSFRGSGKSVFFSKSYPLYHMLKDYNNTCLLVTETDDLAKGYTSSIVEAMLKNPQLIQDFNTPALFDPMKGRQGYTRHEIHLKRSVARKEDTFKACGVGKKVIGIHPELIILDDIIQEGKGKVQGAKLEEWLNKIILPMRRKNTKTIVIGTRKDPEDIYEYIMSKGTFDVSTQQVCKEIPRYEVIRNAKRKIVDLQFVDEYWNVYENARANVFWPQMYTLKEVMMIREEVGHLAFSGEYMNSPVVSEGMEFQRDWLQYYDLQKTLDDNLNEFQRWRIFMGVDIGGASRHADYSCIASIGTFGSKIYILRLNYGHWKIPTLLQQIVKDYSMWSEYGNTPQKVGIETNFMQKSVLEYLDEFTMLPLKGIKQRKKKEERIDPLQTYFERGKVFVDTKIKGYGEFLIEYLNYPNAKHDDVLDAFEISMQLATQTRPAHYGVYR